MDIFQTKIYNKLSSSIVAEDDHAGARLVQIIEHDDLVDEDLFQVFVYVGDLGVQTCCLQDNRQWYFYR